MKLQYRNETTVHVPYEANKYSGNNYNKKYTSKSSGENKMAWNSHSFVVSIYFPVPLL